MPVDDTSKNFLLCQYYRANIQVVLVIQLKQRQFNNNSARTITLVLLMRGIFCTASKTKLSSEVTLHKPTGMAEVLTFLQERS